MWKVTTMTVVCYLTYEFDFRNLKSDKDIIYEVELFPAAQIKRWLLVHVHAFHNGILVVTGLKCFEYLLLEIIPMLKHILPVKRD